jgi:putative hemolysin
LARNSDEIADAQNLRYRVFFEEGTAKRNEKTRLLQRDLDHYDAACEHLLAIDNALKDHGTGVVGTYRLLRRDSAERCGGFYSARAFDIDSLLEVCPDDSPLELGRCCVLGAYRKSNTIELLWRGVLNYALQHHIQLLIGRSSLDGRDINRLARQLSFLHHFASSPKPLCIRALSSLRIEMNQLPQDAFDKKSVFLELPPLIKGYLRIGARFGNGAVIDRKFNTVDVFTILPIEGISRRYMERFKKRINFAAC